MSLHDRMQYDSEEAVQGRAGKGKPLDYMNPILRLH